MDLEVFLEVGDFFCKVFVLEDELLGLFGLELQLRCQLMVLKHS
jgi:hypothetical protein